jgi:NADH-quinone oxidoreductase subunit J
MTAVFYASAAIAIAATALAITRANAVHALLYLIVSLLAAAVLFFTVGAPFVAALEVIVYAGAIMVLFVFVMMMLNLGPQTIGQERQWLPARIWIGPLLLTVLLTLEVLYAIGRSSTMPSVVVVGPRAVGIALFGPYALGVEIASMLLLAGLVGAYHLGRRVAARREPEPARAAHRAQRVDRGGAAADVEVRTR